MTRQEDEDRVDREPAPTEEEVEQARALRDALEGRGDHADAELARALRLAVRPTELPHLEHQAILHRTLAKLPNRRRSFALRIAGVGTSLALAAAVALLVSRGIVAAPGTERHDTVATASLMRSRTTQPLFDQPFPRQGGESARIDRIAWARGRDYRANLFERMGVR
jgi:hypothetical protein